MSTTSASITVKFDGSINSNGPNNSEYFIPSVYPWQYDPAVEANWLNLIVSCDKWVLSNWRGFDFHVPAILYRNQVIADAKERLNQTYADAIKKYKEEYAAWLLKHQDKNINKFQLTYPPTGSKSLTITLATHGIGVGSSSAYFGKNNPKANLNISFAKGNKSKDFAWSGNQEGKACNILPWQLFYDGIGVGKWADPETYNEWEHNIYAPHLSTAVSNYTINGVAGTNGDTPMSAVKWWNGHQFLPFYCYYDTRFNDDKYPNEYAMHDIRFIWDTIQAPTQTLAVNDLGRLYYIPDPITPFPVDSYRVGRDVPIAFPCAVNEKKIYMHLAMGYIPPTGRQDARTSWKSGVTFDITANCVFHPEDKKHVKGGRIEVTPFDFANKLGVSFLDNAKLLTPVGDDLWGQNGLHTIEIINLGTEAAIEVYDPQMVASNKTIRKYYDMQYYVPSYDQGEYLYRKQFAVVNPYPVNLQSAYIVIKYMKRYGHVGTKVVMDIVNPFDHDIIFMHGSESFSQTNFGQASTQQYVNCVLIPKTTGNNHNVVTVTFYGYWDFVNYGMEMSYCLAPTKDYSIAGDYGFTDTFSNSSFRSSGIANIGWAIRNAIQDDSDAICKFPAFGVIWKNSAIQDPVSETELPTIDDGGMAQAFPTAFNTKFGMASGQSCTADFYYFDDNKEICYKAGVKGQARLFTTNFHSNFMSANGNSSGVEAYISPDIDVVYHCPPNQSRRSVMTWNLHETYPVYKPLYLGGAVSTFCKKDDKLSTFNCELETRSEDNTTVVKNIYFGTNCIIKPLLVTFVHDQNGNVTPLNTPTEYNMLNTGNGVWTKGKNNTDVYHDILWCKNIQLTGNVPPILECAMVGRIVLGWDNSAIKVITGNYFYEMRT